MAINKSAISSLLRRVVASSITGWIASSAWPVRVRLASFIIPTSTSTTRPFVSTVLSHLCLHFNIWVDWALVERKNNQRLYLVWHRKNGFVQKKMGKTKHRGKFRHKCIPSSANAWYYAICRPSRSSMPNSRASFRVAFLIYDPPVLSILSRIWKTAVSLVWFWPFPRF